MTRRRVVVHRVVRRSGRRVVLRSALGAVLSASVAACLLVGCGKSRERKKLDLGRDARAVVLIEEPGTVVLADESEPNDEPGQAGAIVLGGGVRGSLDGEGDADMYKVSATADGLLTVRLSGIEGVDLMLDLLDATGAALAHSDRGPALTVEGIAGYPVSPGDYVLAVREFVSKRAQRRREKSGEPGRSGPSPVYELTAEVAAEPLPEHEREPNDSAEGAAELLIGDESLGHIGWARDTDMWKLSIEGFSEQYSLDLDLDGVPGVTLSLEVLDSGGAPVLQREGDKDGGLLVRNLVPAPASGGTAPGDAAGGQSAGEKLAGAEAGAGGRHYYAKITAKRSNPLDTYRLRVATRLLEPDEEIEPNDRPESATPLRIPPAEEAGADTLPLATEGKRRGFLTMGDQDCYQLDAADTDVLLSVDVTPGADSDPILTIASETGTLAMADAGKRGEREHLAAVRIPAGQRVTVTISGRGSAGAGAAYGLTWATEPAPAGSVDDPAPAGSLDDPAPAPVDDILSDYED